MANIHWYVNHQYENQATVTLCACRCHHITPVS